MESNSPATSAEPVVQHRHVQIQTLSKAIDNVSNAQLWKALAHPDVPVIVMSNICTQIVQGVKTDIANLVPVLDQLTAFILTVKNVTKESVLLRAVTKLLLWYCTESNDTITFSVHGSHSGHVHPFITLLQHNHVSNEQLLVEIDYALSHEIAWVFFDRFFATFEPLFDTILLLPSTISPSLLINRITKCISTPASELYDVLRTEALNYLLSVAERSFRQDGTMPLLLLSEITYILVECSDLHALLESEDLQEKATRLLYILLQTACDSAAVNLPILSYVQLIQQLVSATDLCDSDVPICKYNPELLWTSLSLILYSAQTMDDQSILAELLADILPSTSPSVLRVALFPLIQTLTEIESDSSTNNVKLQILEMIQLIKDRQPPNDQVFLEEISSIYQEMEHFKIGGFLQYAVSSIMNREPSDMLKDSSADTVPRQMTMGIALLRVTPTLFEMSGEAPIQSVDSFVRIATKACPSSKKFPAFLLLLHVLHESRDQAEYTNHILQVSIPSLVRSNDPVLTSKVLKIAMSLVQGRTPKHQGIFHKDTLTSLTCVGIPMLFTIYEKQPRVWQYLKAVILDWINFRKSGARGFARRPVTVSEHQTEMAILLITRKLFEEKPLETAQDILPGIVSLLQTVSDLSMPSISLIVLSINACVKADLLDARSIWTIVLSYVAAYVKSQNEESSIPVIKALCAFFEIVGCLKDDSEPVSTMRETILMEYIDVYIKSTIPEIKKSAISALACFQPTDIMSIMEERPKDSINDMLSDDTTQEYAGPLAKLMTYELDHMRRGLFREGDTAQNNRKPATESKGSQESTSQERQILQNIESEWKNFSVSPGLRSGYALASLFGYRVSSAKAPGDLTRQMSAALTDINLSDHLLIRVGSFSAWQALFEDAFGSSVESAERQTEAVIDDLLNRLPSSTVPGLTCNILTALSGCVMALQKISASAATTAASKVIERLRPDYFVSKYSQNATVSSLIFNEDVQFAVRFCIGNISECVISNERMIQSLVAQLLEDLREHTSKVTIEAIVELKAFSSGYGLARLVATMCGYSTKAEYIESLSKNTLKALLDLCFDANLSESAVLGIWMGLASRFDLNETISASQVAQEVITKYDIGKYMNNGKANLIGAFWLCAYAAAQDSNHLQPNDIELISRVASKNVYKNTTFGQHLVVPYGYLLSHISTNADSFPYAQQHLLDLLNQQFNAVKATESPMDTKVAAALTLSAMLGTDYLNPVTVVDDVDKDASEAEQASDQDGNSEAHHVSNAWDFIDKHSLQAACPSRRNVMDVAIQQIGIGKSNVTGNLRAGRITAFNVGNLCRKALLQEQHKNSLNNPNDLEIMASTSAEPKSYSRLAQATSWLRNVFDTLVEISTQPANSIEAGDKANMLLLALQQTIGPLAPVNWFPILLSLSKMSTDIHLRCIHFASTHASSSTSLTEFIIIQLRQVATYLEKGQSMDDRVIQLLASEAGLGKMMELAGLLELAPSSTVGHHRRGVSAMLKPIKLSDERCFETVNALLSVFAKLSEDCKNTALQTLSLHLHNKSEKLTYDLHHLINQHLLSRFVKDTNPPSDTIIQLTVQCSLASVNIEQLVKDLDQVSNPDLLHSKVIVACEVWKAGTTHKSSVQYLSTLLRCLIMFKGEVYTKTWTVLIQTIASDANTTNGLDKYQLLISMLDILIIVLSLKSSDRYDYAKRGIALGLRSVIETCWWSIDAPLQKADSTALEQATYLMGQVISSAQATGFVKHDQLLSRLFRILEIAEEDRTEEADVIQRIFMKTLRIVYASGPTQNGYKIL
ncbi:hypothetical protein BC943DRAFT_357314 [Umbelopsis sp. AD052]|nr:hypothetical protein BC943DRAFT_357314 [Umbelopsis sp. AD052]